MLKSSVNTREKCVNFRKEEANQHQHEMQEELNCVTSRARINNLKSTKNDDGEDEYSDSDAEDEGERDKSDDVRWNRHFPSKWNNIPIKTKHIMVQPTICMKR